MPLIIKSVSHELTKVKEWRSPEEVRNHAIREAITWLEVNAKDCITEKMLNEMEKDLFN